LQSSPGDHVRPITAQSRLALTLVAAATALWVLALAVMAITTSNPTMISHDQLLKSDAVVIGRLAGETRDRLRIEQVLKGDLAAEDEVTVVNWSDVAALPAGPEYLVPLTRFRQNYIVTILKEQRASPLIYRATPETIGEVKRILDEQSR
jgi:hypothetical protein